ncbi:MAG: hypothetical protein GXP55_22465 [Deltaproteobacteria bacterium]|nr:hypothetical protein [Deltaproteobacteria bacterium]
MDEKPHVDPRLRTTLRVALIATLLGSCGVANGVGQLSQTSVASDAGPLDASGDPALRDAARETNAVFSELLNQDPLRRVFAAANVGLSLLLAFAGMLLMMRRESAPWWLTQAVIANSLFILAQALAVIWRIHEFSPRLTTTLDTYLRAANPAEAAELGDFAWGLATTYMMMGTVALWALLRTLIHLLVAWRARKPDVRELLAETQRKRG